MSPGIPLSLKCRMKVLLTHSKEQGAWSFSNKIIPQFKFCIRFMP